MRSPPSWSSGEHPRCRATNPHISLNPASPCVAAPRRTPDRLSRSTTASARGARLVLEPIGAAARLGRLLRDVVEEPLDLGRLTLAELGRPAARQPGETAAADELDAPASHGSGAQADRRPGLRDG